MNNIFEIVVYNGTQNSSKWKKFWCVFALFLISFGSFAQDTSGPVLSSFTQSSTVDITSGGVTITFYLTATDSSTLTSVSSAPFLYSNAGSPTITSGYNTFSNWSVTDSTTVLWQPTDKSGLRTWIDFSNASNYTLSGSSITQVIDRSGRYGTISISNSSNRPTLTSDSSLGRNVATFDGSDDHIDTGTYQDVVSGGSHFALGIFKAVTINNVRASLWSFEAPNSPSSDKHDYAISAGNSSDFEGEIDLDGLSSGNRISETAGDKIEFDPATSVLGSGQSYKGSWRIFNAAFDDSGSKRIFARVDGRQAAYESDYSEDLNNGNLRLRLMQNRGSVKLKGYLAEFLTYESVPGTGGTDNYHIEVAEGYLAHKWNLEGNLATSHPYKTQAPTTLVSYTFSAKLYMDPDQVPDGTYKINLSHGGFIDTSSNTNVASLPSGYGDFTIVVVNDTTAPTVMLTNTDDDNFINSSQIVTITASFSEAMTSTPTLSITGIVTEVTMAQISGTNSYTYLWDTASGSLTDGLYYATVSGTDEAGNPYSGSESITFTLDTTAPTATMTSTDTDNYINTTSVVTITVVFDEAMTATPTLSISGLVTDVILTQISGTNSYTYYWDIDSGGAPSFGSYYATVSGTDLSGNVYSGSSSITFQIGSFYLDANGITVKCPGASDGDTGTVNGKVYTAVTNSSISSTSSGSWDCICTTGVTDLSDLFKNNSSFNEDISSWDTASVTTFHGIFEGSSAGSFNQDIGYWDTSSVTDMSNMFVNQQSFNQDLGSWDTSSVSTTYMLFRGARNFNNGDAAGVTSNTINWDISNVTNMAYMFDGASDFNQNIGSWVTSNVTNLSYTFNAAQRFNQDIGSWDVSKVTKMQGTFQYSWAFNQDIGSWNTASVTIMGSMFRDTHVFNQDIGSWDISNVTNMDKLFQDSDVFNQDISSWDTTNVTSMNNMFNATLNFNQNLSSWCVTTISSSPTDFSTSSAMSASDLPQWGNCPGPSVSFSSSDANNYILPSQTVTITAVFSKSMTPTPTISISGLVTNVAMTQIASTRSYTYSWDVDAGGTPSDGTYTATISGTDTTSKTYSGTDSISFTVDATSPTVTLSSSDSDNTVLTTQQVTITAVFSESILTSPTLSISGLVTDVSMIQIASTNSYTYLWDIDNGGAPADGNYAATVSASDLAGNLYSASDSITFTVDSTAPTVVLSSSKADLRARSNDVITLTATFSKQMLASPTLSISGLVTDVTMIHSSGQTTWTYTWTVSETPIVDNTAYTVTVSGSALNTLAYTGATSLVFKIPFTSSIPTLSSESSLGRDINLDGDQSDQVYLISNLKELLWISEQSEGSSSWANNKVFLQTQDIDASTTQYWDDDDSDDFSNTGANEGWKPIAFNGTFNGFYNGDYNKIIGLTIDRTFDEPVGFIAEIEGQSTDYQAGVIRLGMIDGNYQITKSGSGDNYIGGVIGLAYTNVGIARLTDLFFEGEIIDNTSSIGYQIGGLIGGFVPFDPAGAIENSYANIQITGSRGGGLVGRFSSGRLKNVYARGTITKGPLSSVYQFGGLAERTTPNIADVSIKYAYTSFDFIGISSNKLGAIVKEVDEEYDGTGPEKGYFENIYYNSDFGFAPFEDKDLTDNTFTNIVSSTTTFLKSNQVLAPSGLLSSTVWGQNDAVNDGFPYLKGWKDFGLSKNGISNTSSTGESLGELLFFDAGSGASISYQLTAGDYSNQYFTIDTSTGTPTLKINSSGVAQISSTPTFTILVKGTTNESPPDVLLRKFSLPVKDMTPPTVSLSSTDIDNIINTSTTVTFTATFSKGMVNYPTITIGDGVQNAVMNATTSTTWTYYLDMASWTGTGTTVYVTVQGEDSYQNQYAGTDSLTLVIDSTTPTVSLTDNYPNSIVPYTATMSITATFSESMANSPTISVGGVSSQTMTAVSSSVWFFEWVVNQVSWLGVNTTSTTYAFVSGEDLAGNVYSETTSLTFFIDNSPPTITSVTAAADGSFSIGDTVTVTLNLSEVAYVSGSVSLALILETGSTDRTIYANTSSFDTASITFTYTVQSGDVASDLSYVSSSSLSITGGTLQDTVGNDLSLSLPSPGGVGSLDDNQAIVIDGSIPNIISISQISPDGIYTDDDLIPSNSDTISFTVTFDEIVTITGTPRILLEGITKKDGSAAYASYVSGSGTTTPTFVYTVEDGDISGGVDLDNTSVTGLDLNGGTIKDTSLNDADLLYATNSISLTTGILIEAADPDLLVQIFSDNSIDSKSAKEGQQVTVKLTQQQAYALDVSTISMTISGISPPPSLSFTLSSTS